jgi:histidyl-tRNA synthetase
MRDWLPPEALLRQRLMETIGAGYRLYGYLPIDTPVVEDLAVLLGKGGGENEKLLFKVMKRGEKLAEAQAAGGDPADYGLRFDLTVPLARFIATHQGKLPKVFRRYHIAPVWRADRPQKGRFREFYQCDIDVVGGASSDYEVEIITATERVLKALNLGPYSFRLSDKNLLPLFFQGLGLSAEGLAPLTILLDKLDKIEKDHVAPELQKAGLTGPTVSDDVRHFIDRAHGMTTQNRAELFYEFLKKVAPGARGKIDALLATLRTIQKSVLKINPKSSIVFDPILVRGMDYYTGPIYEAVVEGYPSSILGGGRYDDLIGRFAGRSIPAVGCSLGFERILSIMQERKSGQAASTVSRVLLVNEAQSGNILQLQAEQLRSEGLCIETYLDQDEVGKQLKYAEGAGFSWAIKTFDADSLFLTVRHLATREDRAVSLADFKALIHTH